MSQGTPGRFDGAPRLPAVVTVLTFPVSARICATTFPDPGKTTNGPNRTGPATTDPTSPVCAQIRPTLVSLATWTDLTPVHASMSPAVPSAFRTVKLCETKRLSIVVLVALRP